MNREEIRKVRLTVEKIRGLKNQMLKEMEYFQQLKIVSTYEVSEIDSHVEKFLYDAIDYYPPGFDKPTK